MNKSFEQFWEVCWRRKGKLEAERKFIKALKNETAEFIIEAAKAYADSVRGKDKKFLPHPATWLHQGRYYDELDEPEFDPLTYLKQKREENEDNRIH